MTTPQRQSPFMISRIIAFAMMMGVVSFWLIALFMGPREGSALPVSRSAVVTIIVLLALATLVTAVLVQRSAVEQVSQELVMQRLIVGWALLELPALLAGVCFWFFDARTLLVAVAISYLTGMLMTFPRSEWFEGK